MQVLPTLLPIVALLRLMRPFLRCGQDGTSVPLIAGAGAYTPSARGGALTFHVNGLPSNAWWPHGSANKFSLLVGVLETLLPVVALLRLSVALFRRIRTGTSVPHMLFAGASVGNSPAVGGALTFNVSYSPSDAWWNDGSANKYFK